MQFVDKPDRFSSDMIVPGRVRDDIGFVRLDSVVDGVTGPIVPYLSTTGLRLIASRFPQLGLVDADRARDAESALAALQEIHEKVTAERDELQAKLDRINGLRRDGFQISRVQGRPKKVEAKA